jgi:propanediol dehydratase small subunit
MNDVLEQIIAGEIDMPVLSDAQIRGVAQEIGVQGIAVMAQEVAEQTLKWHKTDEDNYSLLIAETEQGDYQIRTSKFMGELTVDIRTPLSNDVTTNELEVTVTEETLDASIMRAKKICEGQLAWLLTHDTSYETVPEALNF